MFNQEITVTDRTFALMEEKLGPSGSGNALSIIESVLASCERVTPVWPLANFIATNPLKGYEKAPFEQAILSSEKYFHGKALPALDFLHAQYRLGRITVEDLAVALRNEPQEAREKLLQVLIQAAAADTGFGASPKPSRERVFLLPVECLDQTLGTRLYSWSQGELAKWCAAYFDLGQASWSMPGKEVEGFYKAWKRLARFDRSYELAGVKAFRNFVAALPENSLEAIERLVSQLSIPRSLLSDYFSRHFAAMPGWSGLFAYQGNEKSFLNGTDKNAGLIDWLAVRMAYDVAGTVWAATDLLGVEPNWANLVGVLKKLAPETSPPVREKTSVPIGLVWLKAFEQNYRARVSGALKQQLGVPTKEAEGANSRPSAQAVFCIDVRSEVFRRHLEKQGRYETYGFAGFFAVPLAFRPMGSQEVLAQCPVLIRPKYLVDELAGRAGRTRVDWKEVSSQLGDVLKKVRATPVSALSFVEALGGLSLLALAFRGFFPALAEAAKKTVCAVFGMKRPTLVNLEGIGVRAHDLYTRGIPVSDQVAIAENSLRFMGLTSHFGKLVLLCGHRGDTQNNPYASSLDCGACGGHPGAPNARVAAAIFNSPEVRSQLVERGITIPHDTWFVAAEHNTTNERIEILEEEMIPQDFSAQLAILKTDLKLAGEGVNGERFRGQSPSNERVASANAMRCTQDWSEVRPEWGLAGNAAFIIGRRDLTKAIDLGGRAFLHSYRWEIDKNGAALEVIMTAPMVVTQWINAQYYFSSVDPVVFGSGNKTIHNLVGKTGVMEGNVSDLKIGLPFQSVHNGIKLQHEPMRLTVFIEAPLDRIRTIVEKQESVRTLVINEWIHIVAIDPIGKDLRMLNRQLEWES